MSTGNGHGQGSFCLIFFFIYFNDKLMLEKFSSAEIISKICILIKDIFCIKVS